MLFWKKPAVTGTHELELRLVEDGRLDFKEYEMINMVKNKNIQFDDFIDYLDDKSQHSDYLMKFFLQAFFSAFIVIFSMIMLMLKESNEGIYLPVVSGIIGYWLPSPGYKKSSSNKKTGTAIEPKNLQALVNEDQTPSQTQSTLGRVSV